ncbi:hypothetical protein HWV62_30097 [Athelia sp. TMB]|nr:hypothetical protein HWV62_30097 [Athelia sp. TMB]
MPPKQATISRFFSQTASPVKKPQKRPASPIDLTGDSDPGAPPQRKKPRNDTGSDDDSLGTDARAGTLSARETVHVPAGHAEQWRFEPTSPDKPPPERTRSAAEEAVRRKRHEAFKKRLLDENSSFIRSRGVIEDDREDGGSSESSGDESDAAFASFKEVLAKSKGTGKAASKLPARKKKDEELGPSGKSWTPLEKQILQLKKDNPGVLLMVEVGYKIKFFDDDARNTEPMVSQIAAKELGIACFPHRNFTEAMIPEYRRDIHLKKLLSKGYKVGIVQQTETAALKKVGDNRNAPFERKLTSLYTAATYVDELNSVDDVDRYDAPPLMCIKEVSKGGMGVDEHVSIAMITICPTTGDVVYDEFDDSHMRIELETRIIHTKPAELLLPATGLSKSSEKMLAHFAQNTAGGAQIRIERFEETMSYTDAFAFVSDFYTDKTKEGVASESFTSGKLMAAVTDFPKQVVVVLAHTIKYLSAFSIADAFLETKFFSKFTTRAHMLLNGNTLTNLWAIRDYHALCCGELMRYFREIYRNETDYTTRGSLISILDRTLTKFGARLLKSWVGKPLVDKEALQARVDAVEEIISSTADPLLTLRDVLRKLPDLAKGLCRIQYGKV